MNEPPSWRCLLVEDDADNARYIADSFSAQGHAVVTCPDGTQGMRRAMQEDWDIVILDRMLPDDVDGLAILAALRAAGKKTPVLVLSALASLDERVRGLRAGGDDYLTKPFAMLELQARVQALVRRAHAQPSKMVLQVADITANLATRQVERAGRTIPLQPREFRLLVYLMTHAGQLLTRTMLLEAVWDYRFDPQTNVIDVHISRLRRKIDADGAVPLIRTVRGMGYTMDDGTGAGFAHEDPGR